MCDDVTGSFTVATNSQLALASGSNEPQAQTRPHFFLSLFYWFVFKLLPVQHAVTTSGRHPLTVVSPRRRGSAHQLDQQTGKLCGVTFAGGRVLFEVCGTPPTSPPNQGEP